MYEFEDELDLKEMLKEIKENPMDFFAVLSLFGLFFLMQIFGAILMDIM